MRRVSWCLLIASLLPAIALAADPHVTIYGGYNNYDQLRVGHFDDLLDKGAKAFFGSDRTDDGYQLGLGLGLTLDDGFQVELAYQYLGVEPLRHWRIEASEATTSVVLIRGLLPVAGHGVVRPQLGVGVGLINISGTADTTLATGTCDLSGRSIYVEATFGISVWVNHGAVIELCAGYRHAKLLDVINVYESFDLDYSGLTTRLGVRMLLGGGESS